MAYGLAQTARNIKQERIQKENILARAVRFEPGTFRLRSSRATDCAMYLCMPVNPSCVGEPCPTQRKQVVTIPIIDVGKED